MTAHPDDVAQLDRLIAVVEAACGRLAAQGADTTDAAQVLGKLHAAHATARVWLGGGTETPRPARGHPNAGVAAPFAPAAA